MSIWTRTVRRLLARPGFSAVVVLTVVATLVAAWFFLHPRPFTPVVLTQQEQRQLEDKLDRVEAVTGVAAPDVSGDKAPDEYTADGRLRPEAYSEEGANRQVSFTEREVNALIAERNEARKQKQWARSDQIRDQLKEMGVTIEDSKDGTKWRWS